MVGARISAVDLRRPDLRKPFPRRFVARLEGQRVVALIRRAKYLLASLSSDETLLMHLGMSGSLRVVRDVAPARGAHRHPHDDPHDHVVFHMSSGKAVVFNDPRRFGVMELIPAGCLPAHPAVSALGPEPLSDEFDAAALAQACRGKKTSLKAALMDQRVVAGLGNIYASEALHVAGLSPRRLASTLATPSGAPREAAHRLTAAIKHVLTSAIARQAGRADAERPFLVYDRQDEPCGKQNCSGTIRRRAQGGRSTFYCPTCQR
jgi:formamidopyrimidine-DNA glycosylase